MDTKNLAQSIGAAFRVARTARGLTAAQAAELLRLQPDFYGRIESGDSLPTILTCARAVEALGVDPEALFGGGSAGRHKECRERLDAAVGLQSIAHRNQCEAYEGTIVTLSAEVERLRDMVAAAEDAAVEAEAHRDQLGAQAVLSVHDITSERDAALARAESLAAENDMLARELGRVRGERDEYLEEARDLAPRFLEAESKLSDAHRDFAETRAAYESTIEGLSGRLESLAVECEALVPELVAARDQIDALKAEREALLLLAELRDEDPDVTACRCCPACVRCPVHDENPDQLRLSLGTGLTPAGPIITAGVQR